MTVRTETIRSGDAWRVGLRDSDHPGLEVVFTYVHRGGGRLAWVGVSIGPPEGRDPKWVLTATEVRDFPMARWERAARARAVEDFHEARTKVLSAAERYGAVLAEVERVAPELSAASRVKKGKRGVVVQTLTPAEKRREKRLIHLARIAQEYRDNVLSGSASPAADIAQKHNANRNTVLSWIREARQAGLLPPAEPKGKGKR